MSTMRVERSKERLSAWVGSMWRFGKSPFGLFSYFYERQQSFHLLAQIALRLPLALVACVVLPLTCLTLALGFALGLIYAMTIFPVDLLVAHMRSAIDVRRTLSFFKKHAIALDQPTRDSITHHNAPEDLLFVLKQLEKIGLFASSWPQVVSALQQDAPRKRRAIELLIPILKQAGCPEDTSFSELPWVSQLTQSCARTKVRRYSLEVATVFSRLDQRGLFNRGTGADCFKTLVRMDEVKLQQFAIISHYLIYAGLFSSAHSDITFGQIVRECEGHDLVELEYMANTLTYFERAGLLPFVRSRSSTTIADIFRHPRLKDLLPLLKRMLETSPLPAEFLPHVVGKLSGSIFMQDPYDLTRYQYDQFRMHTEQGKPSLRMYVKSDGVIDFDRLLSDLVDRPPSLGVSPSSRAFSVASAGPAPVPAAARGLFDEVPTRGREVVAGVATNGHLLAPVAP